jgi:serine/threonine-protein kinase
MENLTGKQLGPYRVTAPLGEGGMAAVYKAYQAGMDRYVALKVLPQQLAKDPAFVGRFRQEAQVLAKLQHPHILPVFDFGETEGYTYIAMPFVESGTLTDLLTGRPLPLAQIRNITAQIGDALDYAHSLGLVHRDVKPSNVLVDKRGNCLLTDFGIAKLVEGSAKFTNTGGIVGTPAYMSPEQGRGDKVDARTDIYALGIMLYEMAVGRVPYDAETPIAIVFKHISDPLPLPSQVIPNFPDALERVILKALAKNPDERFATAGEMVRALKAALPETGDESQTPIAAPTRAAPPRVETVAPRAAKVPTSAAPPAPSAAAPEQKTSNRWRWVAGSVGLLAVCACLAVSAVVVRNVIQNRNRQHTATSPIVSAVDNATPTAPSPVTQPVTAQPTGQDSITILKAGAVEDNFNTIDTYEVVVQYTFVEDNGVLEVWAAPYTDANCNTEDLSSGSHETVYYNAVNIEKSSGEKTIPLTGAPTRYKYLGVGARITDVTVTDIFTQDTQRVCMEVPQATPVPQLPISPFTKSPPALDGVASPGEWDLAGEVFQLPHGLIRAMNDNDDLYLLLDVTGDTTADPPLTEAPWGDYFALLVDVNENATIDPNIDIEYGMSGERFGLTQVLGPNTFTDLLDTASKAVFGYGGTAAALIPHRYWEVALNLKELDAAPGESVRMGVLIASQEPAFADETPPGFQSDYSNLITFTLSK